MTFPESILEDSHGLSAAIVNASPQALGRTVRRAGCDRFGDALVSRGASSQLQAQ